MPQSGSMGRHVTRSELRVRLARSAAVSAVALLGAVAASGGGFAPLQLSGPGSTFLGWALVAPFGPPTALNQARVTVVEQPVALGPGPRRPSSDRPVTTSGGPGPGDGASASSRPPKTGGSGGPAPTSAPGATDTGSTGQDGQPVDTGTPPQTLVPESSTRYPIRVSLGAHAWSRPFAPASTDPASTDPTVDAGNGASAEPADVGERAQPGNRQSHRAAAVVGTVRVTVWTRHAPVQRPGDPDRATKQSPTTTHRTATASTSRKASTGTTGSRHASSTNHGDTKHGDTKHGDTTHHDTTHDGHRPRHAARG